MSLLEWFLESKNPGPVGKVKINSSEPDDGEPPRKWIIWVVVVIGLVLTGMGLYWVFYNTRIQGAKPILIKLCCFALYVLISHSVTATPDHTNMGWLGVIDNPFRISDDFNRWLLFIQIILLPGKLVAYSLAISWLLGQHLYKKLKG
jgi:amino acid transporter